MSEKSIRWFCPTCNDFVSIRKTDELREKVLQVKRLPYPIIIKHGDPPHYSILQLDKDLRDRGRLTSMDYIDLTDDGIKEPKPDLSQQNIKEKLAQISEEISSIQRKIWTLMDE